jgi:hypothetical protein
MVSPLDNRCQLLFIPAVLEEPHIRSLEVYSTKDGRINKLPDRYILKPRVLDPFLCLC